MKKTFEERYNEFVDRLIASSEKALKAGLKEMRPDASEKCKVATASMMALKMTMMPIQLAEALNAQKGIEAANRVFKKTDDAISEFEQAVDADIYAHFEA